MDICLHGWRPSIRVYNLNLKTGYKPTDSYNIKLLFSPFDCLADVGCKYKGLMIPEGKITARMYSFLGLYSTRVPYIYHVLR